VKRAIAAAIVLAACTPDEPLPPAPIEKPAVVRRGPVQTDRTHYRMQEGSYRPEATIVITFTAPANQDV
jgi:hypothetical protein